MIILGTFTKNTLITFFTRILTGIFGVIILAIIGRYLGAEGAGIYSLAILLPAFLLTFSNFAINTATVFYIGKKKYPPKEILGSNIIFIIFNSIFVILIGSFLILFFGNRLFPGVGKEYLFLALALIPFSFLFDFISHILIGLQKIKKYNIVSFLQSFFFLILIVILLLGFRFGIWAAISAHIISFILASIVLFFIVKKEVKGLILKINKQYLKDAFSYGFKAYLGSVFDFLNKRASLFLINIFIRNPVAVGFYYAASGLAEKIWGFSISAAIALFPKVAAENDQKRLKEFTPLVYRSVFFITFLIVILLFIFSDWLIVLLYSETFLASVTSFRILLIGALFTGGWIILTNDLSARGKPILTTYIIGVSTILNIILNIVLIPKKGIEGAAWAVTISHFLMMIISIFVYSRVSGNKIRDIILPKKIDVEFYRIFLSRFKNLKVK